MRPNLNEEQKASVTRLRKITAEHTEERYTHVNDIRTLLALWDTANVGVSVPHETDMWGRTS